MAVGRPSATSSRIDDVAEREDLRASNAFLVVQRLPLSACRLAGLAAEAPATSAAATFTPAGAEVELLALVAGRLPCLFAQGAGSIRRELRHHRARRPSHPLRR